MYGTKGSQRGAPNILELKLLTVMSYHVGAGKDVSSTKAAGALNV